MRIGPGICIAQSWAASWREIRRAVFRAVTAAVLLFLAGTHCEARAQAVPAAEQERLTIYAGATGSGQYLQFFGKQMFGITGFVDADTSHHLGYTVEGGWIAFRQVENVHTSTLAGGLRYHLNEGRFVPYAKALAGIGEFNFPFNLATGRYLILTGGAGIDYNLGRRFRLRLADFEYTGWPQFPAETGGTLVMSTMTVSSGIKIRIY